MMLKIFIPAAFVILPVLAPLNAVPGKGLNSGVQVTGLDRLAWGNVSTTHTSRYWAHWLLALILIIYLCYVVFEELRDYIRLRQHYLTSQQHRLRPSANTVLISCIPEKWCSAKALEKLYNDFPGGIRNIWLNRNFDELSEKVRLRDKLAVTLESAETDLIRKCFIANEKRTANKAGERPRLKSAKEPISVRCHGISYKTPSQAQCRACEARCGSYADLQSIDSAQEDTRDQMTLPIRIMRKGIQAIAQVLREWRKSLRNIVPLGGLITVPDLQFSPDSENALWRKYIKNENRATMRLPIFGWQWKLVSPLFGRKVDTIYYCRQEIARLDVEIRNDQRYPERFPLINSAFIQFNHQIAAHMACQSTSHHLPKQMAPRLIEIDPKDVIWENMSISWWLKYIRIAAVISIIAIMVVLWAIPVAFTSALSQLSTLAEGFRFLHFFLLLPTWFISVLQGVLPSAFLAILMVLLPRILRFLAKFQGTQSGMLVELLVQKYFFAFLFVQIFLVVSVAAAISTILTALKQGAEGIATIPNLLATNIPRASNYFFSYMLLQALSVSAGALVQISSVVKWFILAPLLDNTARAKFKRRTRLLEIRWGTFFPVYTNLACIGLIYSVISPLILVFSVVTFSLFWFVYRYNTLYVTKFTRDTGGLLFPTAINYTFFGVYVMEAVLVGMFFLVRDEEGAVACYGQGLGMAVILILTAIYQILLNKAFSPLFEYLPITLQGDVFQRGEEGSLKQRNLQKNRTHRERPGVNRSHNFKSRAKIRRHPTSKRSRRGYSNRHHTQNPTTKGLGMENNLDLLISKGDLEAQMAARSQFAEALFQGINDDLKDLTSRKRARLIKNSFRHSALNASRPAIWLPNDDLGVSEDEIRQIAKVIKKTRASNVGQDLDIKGRCVYTGAPPDFPKADLIQL
jgi:calcium permeable stress-gated cation channel